MGEEGGNRMTVLVRQNTYGAWLDGDVSAMEALQALCNDYEELDDTYKQFEKLREMTRDHMGNVLVKLDGKAEIKGFGTLTISAPVVVESFDKAKVQALINDLVIEHPDIAARLLACKTKSSRAGGLRIERER